MKREPKKYDISAPFLVLTSDGTIMVRQATKAGYIACHRGGIFDPSYPNSLYRRSRVKSDNRCCGCLTAVEPEYLLYECVKEIEINNTNFKSK